MSRLSEILGVEEGQEFRFRKEIAKYKIEGDMRLTNITYPYMWSLVFDEDLLLDMIAHPELIHPIPEKPQLTEQQITAIKGRIAEGTPWAARSQEQIYFYENKPLLVNDDDCSSYFRTADFDGFGGNSDFYDFITDDNSPVYLPELVEGSE